jgi:prephenate dehydrogenase/GNAT superfamily N-acetyltransferase
VSHAAPFGRVFLAGCGLVGGSLGLVIRALWPDARVTILDPAAPETVRQHFTLATSPADAADADLIVLGAPVGENTHLLEVLAPHAGPDAVITDVGSTKRAIVDHARRVPCRAVFVGGHPMAGSAHSGFAHASAGLFASRPWILTPDTAHGPSPARVGRALASLTQLVCAVGARPVVMSATEHDRLVAYISHLPQLLSSSLMSTVGRAVQHDGLQFSGPGLLDMTRLAASAPALWQDIFAANADFVEEALTALRALLPSPGVLGANADATEPLLRDGRRWRQALEAAATSQMGRRRYLPRAAVRTYLEMTSPEALLPAPWPHDDVTLRRLDDPPAALYRFLYREVGRPWHWIERWDWSDRRISEHLATPGIEVWLLTAAGVPAGWFELHRTSDETEIAYFGLLPAFTGQGLGRALLTRATEEAWRSDPRRVWLHTCSLDHPAALRNYTARGFRPYRDEPYDAKIPLDIQELA